MIFKKFRLILDRNIRILELMGDMSDKLSGEYVFDRQYIHTVTEELSTLLRQHMADLDNLEQKKNTELLNAFDRIYDRIQKEISGIHSISDIPFTCFPEELLTVKNHALRELGNENIMMGEIRNVLKLPVPAGFFATTRVFSDFMEYNGLAFYARECVSRLGKAEETDSESAGSGEKPLKTLRSLILKGGFPENIVWDILAATENMNRKSGRDEVLYAVCGCEWIKGKESVVHPKFRTLLNIPQKEILNAYKEVIADFICSSAFFSLGSPCYPDKAFALSAGFISMIDSGTSGFLCTMDPGNPNRDVMMIWATFGLGGGRRGVTGNLDHYTVSRDHPHSVVSTAVTRKDRMLTPRSAGGTRWINIPHYTCRAPSLKESRIKLLAETAMLIERYYKRPLRISWCFDREEKLYILQVNFLIPGAPEGRTPGSNGNGSAPGDPVCYHTLLPVEDAIRKAKILFSGKGVVVQGGIATGKVFVVRSEQDLEQFPSGAVLVSAQTSPRFFSIIRKAKGILTGTGSPTGHMAGMARELRVPAIVNCGTVLKELKTGDEITIDAACNVVYCGAVRELQRYELIEEYPFEESEEYLLLKRLKKYISPLNLIDPHSKNFAPSGCHTYHDIMRYVHEKSIQKLIDLSRAYKHRRHVPIFSLETDIPLGIFLAEIEEKIKPGTGNAITEEEVHSVPMRALLQGLRESGMWSTRPLSVDMKSFMSSLTRTFSYSTAGSDHTGMNLALISEDYMNLNLRLGYHYTIIDALISEGSEENRISFRFFGGVTDFSRRSMRARFIRKILEKFDFRVESHGDLVVGRIKKAEKSRMIKKMKMIGGLIGYTRQLDVQMNSEDCLAAAIDDFENRIRLITGGEDEHHEQ